MFSFRGPVARPATTDDLALADLCRGFRSSHGPDTEAIVSICERAAPIVAEIVSDVRRGSWFYSQDPVSPLRSYFVCGPASETLGLILASGGVNVGRARCISLGDDYPSPDHQFLIASDGERRIVIDPAYHQFLKPFGERASSWPDVLVSSLADLADTAGRIAAMAGEGENLGVRALRNMEMTIRQLPSGREALREYFHAIWNVERQGFTMEQPGSYATDLERYRRGDTTKIDPDRTTYLRLLSIRGII